MCKIAAFIAAIPNRKIIDPYAQFLPAAPANAGAASTAAAAAASDAKKKKGKK